MLEKVDLGTNKNDIAAAILKSCLGVIPGIGSALSEIVGFIIPNQKIDRIVEYVRILDTKISNIHIDIIDSIKNNEYFIDLMEESFIQASRAISNERREYIASVVIEGIKNEEQQFLETKYVLKLLSELNDAQVIILASYHFIFNTDIDQEFRERHKNIIGETYAPSGATDSLKLSSDVKDNYRISLLRLGLLTKENKSIIEEKSGSSVIRVKEGNYELSRLGFFLLKHINIIK